MAHMDSYVHAERSSMIRDDLKGECFHFCELERKWRWLVIGDLHQATPTQPIQLGGGGGGGWGREEGVALGNPQEEEKLGEVVAR